MSAQEPTEGLPNPKVRIVGSAKGPTGVHMLDVQPQSKQFVVPAHAEVKDLKALVVGQTVSSEVHAVEVDRELPLVFDALVDAFQEIPEVRGVIIESGSQQRELHISVFSKDVEGEASKRVYAAEYALHDRLAGWTLEFHLRLAETPEDVASHQTTYSLLFWRNKNA